MKISNSKLLGVKVITPPTIFEDFRGTYVETYNEAIYNANGITEKFIQDDISMSHKGVLRGIHGDEHTSKLVSCLFGSFYLLVVNNDNTSNQYKKWLSFNLSSENKIQVLIPPKFGNGHIVISESAIFHYKQTTYYKPSNQFTIKWNDPDFKFWWPISNPILSKRDS